MNCDIIIPVWNQTQLTRECIDSIIQHTSFPYKLIIIDNGSQRQTKEYLEELSRDNKQQVTLIRNEVNLGYVKAVNQGLKASDGDYVCLLNNDAKVKERWLEELIMVAQSNPRIGIVNPGGNPSSYKKKGLIGKYTEIGFATGFCMLIKRGVIDKVGFLDEAYEIGFWEDTDYCQRAKRAGYICVAAKAAYVYHHSHRSFNFFKKNKVNELFEKNKNVFYSKWGEILRIACVVFKNDISDRGINEILKLVGDGHMVYLFLRRSAKLKTDIEHGNIREFKYPDLFFNFCVSMKILHRQKKNKKKFGKILTDNLKFASKVRLLNSDLEIEMI